MEICIDATSLSRKITGIESYALNLIDALLRYDRRNRYVLLFRGKIHRGIIRQNTNIRIEICSFRSQIICEQIWLPSFINKLKVDLVHFPAFPPGFLFAGKSVVTIHDATLWKYPETLSWKGKLYFRPLTIRGIQKAAKVLTVSEFSRKEITSCAAIDESKVVNTGEAIAGDFKKISQLDKLKGAKQRLSLPDQFLLSVCSIEPRKNIGALLEAFNLLLSKKRIPKEFKLVLVGRKAWGSSLVEKKIHKLELENNILLLGHVSTEDLVLIYNLAQVFVYPSLYEGFGLPPLEAMACCTPVVASNVASLPEVLGDAAILVDPKNVEEIAGNIESLICDKELRESLVKKGLNRVKQFSWEQVAKKTVAVYESLR